MLCNYFIHKGGILLKKGKSFSELKLNFTQNFAVFIFNLYKKGELFNKKFEEGVGYQDLPKGSFQTIVLVKRIWSLINWGMYASSSSLSTYNQKLSVVLGDRFSEMSVKTNTRLNIQNIVEKAHLVYLYGKCQQLYLKVNQKITFLVLHPFNFPLKIGKNSYDEKVNLFGKRK